MKTVAPLVGLYSPAAQSGKSTVAHALRGFGWHTAKFAGPLKAMVRALYDSLGADPETIERMTEGDLKEVPMEVLGGRTSRYIMQTVGSEWGRGLVAPDFWVKAFLASVQAKREMGFAMVADDMRFPNEALAVRQAGGILVKVIRPGVVNCTDHASEGALEDFDFDMIVENTSPSATAFALEWAPQVSKFAWYKATGRA